ncbi:class I adenylate-forming enzyme family protein [Actinomadura sp. NTSP31]|uniref:class I adenylate-forming enzyme family protein n=1 Tax=Actinomadura sp. NTSP31 TaxID=1735447 RepID=UPI0035C1981B
MSAGEGPAAGGDALLEASVGDVLRQQALVNGDRPAVLWEAGGALRRLTYRQLEARANAVAYGLSDLEPGDRVAVWGRNCVEWVLLEHACALRGLVLAPLNTAWTNAEAAAAIELAEPSVLFTGEDGRGVPLEERARLLAGGTGVRTLRELSGQADAPPARRDVPAGAPFLMQFTSGTTGRAKGALLSHRSVLNAAHLRERRDLASGGVCLNSVPYHHIGGSLYVVLGALTSGGAFIVVDRFDPEQTVRLLSLAGVTHLGGVPIMIERVLDRPGLRDAARTVKTVALGGADIGPRLVRRIQDELDAGVLTTYGQSECPIITCSTPSDDPESLATTAGRPVEATEVRIVDRATGRAVAPGETGEILVRSPLVMEGYFRKPERTAEVLAGDGFLRTGDLGSMDADGNVVIRGRSREVIIRGGENIYPAEVEAALSEHPEVAACAVVGVADPDWGELVGASVVPRGDPIDPQELEAFLSGRIAHFKIPRVWRFVPGLPMTAAGKCRRTQVKEEMNTSVDRLDARRTPGRSGS